MENLWLHVSYPHLLDRWVLLIELIVAACAAAGQLPPPGWTERDKTGKVVSPSDLTRRGQSISPSFIKAGQMLIIRVTQIWEPSII